MADDRDPWADVPDWGGRSEAEVRAEHIERARRREELSRAEQERAEEMHRRNRAWHELRKGWTIEEVDTWVYNLAKVAKTQKEVAEALGMTSIHGYMRRYRDREARREGKSNAELRRLI